MALRWQLALCFMICLSATVYVAAQDSPPLTTLTIDQPLHFLKEDGGDLLLPSGLYRLEAAQEHQLRLVPGATADPITVEAIELPHDRELTDPVAGTLATDEDTVHVVLFLPGNTALAAVGSRSGVRTRAGALTSTQLSQVQVSPSTIRKMVQSVRTPGSPPSPILGVPIDGSSIVNPIVTFSWRDGDGSPRATSFKLCVAEVGKACGQPGSVVYPLANQPPITGTMIDLPFGPADLPHGQFQGKRLVWTVAACAPNTQQPTSIGTTLVSCTYAPLRPIYWPLPAPRLKEPEHGAELSSLRPTFRWEYTKNWLGGINVMGVDYWLICIGKPGIACPNQPVSSADMVVVQVPPRASSPSSVPVPIPNLLEDQEYRPSINLTLLQEGPLHWTVAACNATFGCNYQQDVRQVALAVPGTPTLYSPTPGAILQQSTLNQGERQNLGINFDAHPITFSWQAVLGATKYKLCLAAIDITCGNPPGRDTDVIQNPNHSLPLYRSMEGGGTTMMMAIPDSFWFAASNGQKYHWFVTGCTAAGSCKTSAPRPIKFSIPATRFYWLYPAVQDKKCTNCHGMANQNAKFQQHVREGRFPANTNPTQPSSYTNPTQTNICAACHRSDTGFVDGWRAPPSHMDFTGLSINETCAKLRGKGTNTRQFDQTTMREHLFNDPMVLWAVPRMTHTGIEGPLGTATNILFWQMRVSSWLNKAGHIPAHEVHCP